MIRPTISRLGLLSACAWWGRTEATWHERSSADASFGTRLHALAEAYIEGRPLPSTGDDLPLAAVWTMLAAWITANRRVGWRSEIAFAFDVDRGAAREIPRATHRDYSSATEREICGTADLVYMAEDEQGPFACVDDFKWSGFHGDALKAQAQLAGLALCVSRAWGVERVRARAIRISDRGVDDATEMYWLDALDLVGVEGEIADAIASIPSAEPAPGEHCTDRWCPAVASCPAQTRAMEQVIPDAALVRKGWRYQPVIESTDHLAWLLTMRPLLRKAMDQVDAAISDAVENGPVQTTDGRTIEATTRTMQRVNAGALEALARELGATDEQIAGCVRASVEGAGVKIRGGAAKRRAA